MHKLDDEWSLQCIDIIIPKNLLLIGIYLSLDKSNLPQNH